MFIKNLEIFQAIMISRSLLAAKLVEKFTFEAESCLFFTRKLQSRFSRNFVFQKFNFKMLYLGEFCTLEARRGHNQSKILSSTVKPPVTDTLQADTSI